jgi:L-histidine Nalpha-methyltransferase
LIVAAPQVARCHTTLSLAATQMAADVRCGLLRTGQKELPSKYLYDELGSALFEAICLLPEYGLNRAGGRLMQQHAHEIARRLPRPLAIAELGSGNGTNTRWLLEALAERAEISYYPIDISSQALVRCRQELGELNRVRFYELNCSYLEGLSEVAARRHAGEHLLVLFLGSTIGNFDRPAGDQFLAKIRETLYAGDALLLATDLEKPVPDLLQAYDDPTGVTAAFNLNLLARINRELDANFDLRRFRHQARWSARERRVEMHLLSLEDQRVEIPLARFGVNLSEGETIWTESSHKYNCAEVARTAIRAGYRCQAQWVDQEWPFAESLLTAV